MKMFSFFLFVSLSFVGFSQNIYDTASLPNSGLPQSTSQYPGNDSSSGNSKLKSTINSIYQKIDKSPTTQKYVQQFDNLKQKANNKYRKIDSVARAGTQEMKSKIGLRNKSAEVERMMEDSAVINQNKNDSLALLIRKQELVKTEKQTAKEKLAADYVNNGFHYLKIHKATEAASSFEKGLSAAKEAHSLSITQQALEGLSEAYAQKSDSKKALSYFKLYSEVKDSLLKLKSEEALSELNAKYESEKKQNEIQSLLIDAQKKKDDLQEKQLYIHRQGQFILLIVLALCLTIVLAFSLFRQYRSKKKMNETLLIQNNKITEQKKELEESLNYTKQLQGVLKEDLDHYMQAALRKQMNPHFIFNSLNSIQSLILQNDKLSATNYLSKFSSLMRKILENSQHHLISLSKEIEVLKLYIEMEEQRFDNSFSCIWSIDENLDLSMQKVPPLLMQPYIENAIWHGLLQKEGIRTLTISIIKKGGHLICTIEDNGIGRAAAMNISKNRIKHESLGTKITQKRINVFNSLNKSGIDIQYHDLYDLEGIACGTKVELTIPVLEPFFINEQE